MPLRKVSTTKNKSKQETFNAAVGDNVQASPYAEFNHAFRFSPIFNIVKLGLHKSQTTRLPAILLS